MKKNEEKELISLIAALFVAKGKPMQAGTFDVWVDLLQEYPFEDLKDAFIHEMKSKNEWPTVGHIVSAVMQIINSVEPMGNDWKVIVTDRVLARREWKEKNRGGHRISNQSKNSIERNLY